MLNHGLLRELLDLARLTATTAAAAAAPSPASSAALAFKIFDAILAFRFLCGGLLGFSFRELFFLNFLDGRELRLSRSKIARGFRRMHLLAAVDHVRLLSCYGGISRDGDCYAETFLQVAKMRALVIEHIERHFGARTDDQIVSRALDQHFLNSAQQLQRDRRHRSHVTASTAHRTFFGRAFEDRCADALSRHFQQAEMRDAADLDAGAIMLERLF